MRTTAYLGLAALLMFAVSAPVLAQEQTQDAPDVKAYRPIYDPSTEADRKAELAEAFLADTQPAFVGSTYRSEVFLLLFKSYKETKNWLKALDTVDRLEKLVPKTPSEMKVRFLADAMGIAWDELMDAKRAIVYGDKILALDSKNVNALLTLAMAIPTPLPDDPAGKELVLTKVVDSGRRLLDLPKPAAVSEEQWQNIRGTIRVQNQSFVSRMFLDKKDYVACTQAYEELTRMTPKDAAAHYGLGICRYYQVRSANELAVAAREAYRAFVAECNKSAEAGKEGCGSEANKVRIEALKAKDEELTKDFQAKRDSAIEAFARAVAIGGAGPEVPAARAELEKLYKTKSAAGSDKPLDGLDDLIAQKKKELGV